MKIVHVTRKYWPFTGGVETFVKSLASTQVKQGYNVSVVTLKNSQFEYNLNPGLSDSEIKNGVMIHRTKGYGLHNYLYAPGILRFLEDADLVHVHNVDYLSEFIGFSKIFHKKPIILSTHGGFFHSQRYNFLRLFRLKYFTSFSIRFYDYILCTSEEDLMRFGLYAKKSIRFPNAIQIPNLDENKIRYKKDYILYVGRMQKHKQLELLIQSISFLVHKYNKKDIKCLIVGPDWGEKSHIASLITRNNLDRNIFILGKVDDDTLNKLQRTCGLFVSPSAFESFGLTVLESMSWGNLVLANNIPSYKELINDGENGWITDFRQTEQAANKILKIINMSDRQKNMIRMKARKKSEAYTWDNRFKKLDDIYCEALQQ